jgi:hypothetical protein
VLGICCLLPPTSRTNLCRAVYVCVCACKHSRTKMVTGYTWQEPLLDLIDAPPWEGPISVEKKTPLNPEVRVFRQTRCRHKREPVKCYNDIENITASLTAIHTHNTAATERGRTSRTGSRCIKRADERTPAHSQSPENRSCIY